MHIYDVGMAEFSGLADLLAQELEGLGAKVFFQDLDREGLAGHLLIGGQVHHPHSPLADFALKPVGAGKLLTDREPVIPGGVTRLVSAVQSMRRRSFSFT